MMRPDPLQVMHVDVNGGMVTWKNIMITRVKESINTQNLQYSEKETIACMNRNQYIYIMHLLDLSPCMLDKLLG
jgi:hypothetical protein